MSKIKIGIAVLMAILVILIATIAILTMLREEEPEIIREFVEEPNDDIELPVGINRVSFAEDFLAVEFHVSDFLTMIAFGEAEEVYNMLCREYITEHQITMENVLDRVPPMVEMQTFQAMEMYYVQHTLSHMTFFAYGITRERVMDEIGDYQVLYITVRVDMENSAFAVVPNLRTGITNLQELHDGYNINQENTEVPRNEYNRFNREGVTQERLIQEYFSRFIDNALFSTHRAFNMLDSEFREKRFNNSLQEFERYIDRNFVYLAGSRLERYSVAQGEGYTRYVLIDQGERIFILLETGIMQFTVILDTYTLDLPEFVERYMSANSQERVALNIQRLIQALNEQDYRFVYNRLAESFRQNYFQELGHFEAYIRHTLPERMQIEHLAFNEESGLYMQTIRFIDISDENREPVEKRIVMELREGTDFVFAFNIIQ